MLNPKHILQLDQAIHLILGPHSDKQAVTQLIMRGQQSLNQLRIQTTYPSLLSSYLTSSTHKKIIDLGVAVTNYFIFVLLEIKKLTPLHDETIWWHLLEFYYKCNERLENFVIDIILQHFIQYNDAYSNCYKPFISVRYEGNQNIPMYKLAKLLRIVKGLVSQLQKKEQRAQRDQNLKQWRQSNCLFLIQSLCIVYRGLKKTFCSFSQQIVIKILYLFLIIHKTSQQWGAQNEKFCISTKIQSFIFLIQEDIGFLSKTTQMLLFLFYHQFKQCNQDYRNIGYIDKQIFLTSLKSLLKSRPSKNPENYQQLFILGYSLFQLKANDHILQTFFQQIEQAFFHYITEVQLKRQPAQLLLQSQTQLLTSSRYSNRYKYLFLTEALCRKDQFFLQLLSRKSQLNLVLLLGFCQFDCLKFETKVALSNSIITYYKSVIHHPNTYNLNFINSSFKFLYRFVIEDPGFDLFELCQSLLDLRARFAQLQIYCDILLCRGIEMVVTCNQRYKLMDLLELWIKNLEENYMDVCVGSYYPILILMEETQELQIIRTASEQLLLNPNIKFLRLFNVIIDLIVQQTLNNKESKKPEVSPQWYDIMDIFYKWSTAFVKYIVNLLKSKLVNIETYRRVCQQLKQHRIQGYLIQNRIQKIVNLSISHVFKNELYSTETAFIYLLYLLGKVKQEGAQDLIESMMCQSFWKYLSLDQVLFHCCIFVGIQIFYHERFDFGEINKICSQVLGKKIQAEVQAQVEYQMQNINNNIQQVEKIKNEVLQFIFLFPLQNQLKENITHLLQNIFSFNQKARGHLFSFNPKEVGFKYQANSSFSGYRH